MAQTVGGPSSLNKNFVASEIEEKQIPIDFHCTLSPITSLLCVYHFWEIGDRFPKEFVYFVFVRSWVLLLIPHAA